MLRLIAAGALLALPGAAVLADGHEEITVSHGYSNFGELKYGPDEPFAYVNPDAPKGGEVSFATLATFDSFNQFSIKGVTESTASTILYEDIMISAADDPYGAYCYLCTTIEYPESLDWVVVNLREDVRFHDGTPMTAEDVKFTVDLFLEQGIPEFRRVVESYFASVEVTGPYQVRFEFNEAAPFRSRVGLAGLWNPFSKAEFEEKGLRLDDSAEVPFMGTGPYRLDSVDMGRTVTYRKVEDWWGEDLPINRGRHNFETIRIEAFLDNTAALEAFKAGEYTVRSPGSAKEWAVDMDFPAVERGWVLKEALPDGNIGAARGLAFNLRREPWQDPNVRRAVELMFNFEWSNETLFYGLYERPYSFWQGSDLAAEGVPTEGERAVLAPLVEQGLLDASILEDEAYVPPTNDPSGNAVDRRTRRQALALLEEAGWTIGDGGMLRNAAGETLPLSIIQFSADMDRVMNPFVDNLRSIGIDASLRRVDTAQYTELRRSREWDLSNILPGQGFEPGSGLQQWFGSATREDSSRNIMGLADPAVDALIDQISDATTLDDLRDRTRALDRVLRAHGWWLSNWGDQENWVAYWDQYERPAELPPLQVGILDFWWFDEAARERLIDEGAPL